MKLPVPADEDRVPEFPQVLSRSFTFPKVLGNTRERLLLREREEVESYGDGARSSSRSSLDGTDVVRGGPLQGRAGAAAAHDPSLSGECRRAAGRAKLRELGAFMLPV